MKTFYEEIMKWVNHSTTDQHKAVFEVMDKSEIIHIQNVADYFFEVTDQEIWTVEKDFPNLAPPFPYFWMEYNPPQIINGEYGKINVINPHLKKIGILVASKDIENESVLGEKWALNILLFLNRNDGAIVQPMAWVIAVDKQGRVICLPDGRSAFMGELSSDMATSMGINQSNIHEKLPDGRYYLFHAIAPALLAISFMHCKNVDLVSNKPKETTEHKRRNRNQSRVIYHTLQIEPMKKILRNEGQSETTGIKHALHICRGHFKDFSNGKGLFGRHQGLYWWDSQIRGSSKNGITLKDYNVKP